MSDRIKPGAHKAEGAIKRLAGKVSGDRSLEDEGRVEDAGANVHQAAQKVGDAVRESVEPDRTARPVAGRVP